MSLELDVQLCTKPTPTTLIVRSAQQQLETELRHSTNFQKNQDVYSVALTDHGVPQRRCHVCILQYYMKLLC
jgi:hypothetical protein